MITQDGAVAVRTRSNGTSIGVADADSTQEVQILTSNYNAEYGRASGGQIRVVTKSGTKDFHGTAYEYFRNSSLDANQWSRNNDPDPNVNSQAAPLRLQGIGHSHSSLVAPKPNVARARKKRMRHYFRATLITSWRLHQLCDKLLHGVRWDTQTAVCQWATVVQDWLALLERWPVRTLKELTDRNHVPP